MRWGIGPSILSIMARCSLLSWVCWHKKHKCAEHGCVNEITLLSAACARVCHLVQRETSVVLKQDAADAPGVTRVTPAQLWGGERGQGHNLPVLTSPCRLLAAFSSKLPSLTKYDLRSSVVTCGYDGRVVLVVKGGAAEVNEPHRGVIYSPLVAFLKEEGCSKAAGLYFELKILCSK